MAASDNGDLTEKFERARQAQSLGRIAEAEAAYIDILSQAPDHVGALNLLGVCRFQQGRLAEGVPLLEKALALDPDSAEAHNNLANGLRGLRRFADAADHYRRALQLRPELVAVANNLGIALMECGKPEEAWPQFERAMAQMGERADVFNNGAMALGRLGRLEEAEALLRKAVALRPEYAEAHNNLGGVLLEQGRGQQALMSFARAVELKPDYAAALYNLANALASLHCYEDALASYDRALARDPRNVLAFKNRALTLLALERPEEAVDSLDRAIALDPARADAWGARANAKRDLHRFDDALADYGEAASRGADAAEVTFNRAILHLLRGDFAAGWPDYEARWRFGKFIARSAGPLPPSLIARLALRPTRETFAGKRCLVVGEQGLGDQVMFASLLGDLARDAAHVSCLCAGKLAGLLARSFPAMRVGDLAQPDATILDGVDVVVAMGSLAHAYRASPDDCPGVPYLAPSADKAQAWRARLAAGGRRVIGLSWRGGAAQTRGAGRSLALEDFLPLMRGVDARFVSLQYGEVADEVAAFNARHGQDVLCLPRAEIEAFDDLAALIAATDGVLSVQTALIHLCGAIGHPCWTLVPQRPEWRYGLTAETMPWYRSVRLVRQGSDGGWTRALAKAEALLNAQKSAS
ncbi:MAG TPA: tetratricopeptide repeat protein [Alphaproteobacteria bacterium]|nr:tetratricopeptide repeat protein [Alphaproteobacteria bacterium]